MQYPFEEDMTEDGTFYWLDGGEVTGANTFRIGAIGHVFPKDMAALILAGACFWPPYVLGSGVGSPRLVFTALFYGEDFA